MRKVLIPALFVLMVFLIPVVSDSPTALTQPQNQSDIFRVDSVSTSSAGGVGGLSETKAYMSRELTGLSFGIYNSYNDESLLIQSETFQV